MDLLDMTIEGFWSLAEAFKDVNGTCLLYSGGEFESAETSYLSLFPIESVTISSGMLTIQKGSRTDKFAVEDPWKGLQEHFFCRLEQECSSMAFGWFGYSMGSCADDDSQLPYRASTMPDAYWQRSAVVVQFSHRTGLASMQIRSAEKDDVDFQTAAWLKALSSEGGWKQLLQASLPCSGQPVQSATEMPSSISCEDYLGKIRDIQELILSGDVYQVNLSKEFKFQSSCHPFTLFRQIADENPAPFAAYFCVDRAHIVSTSPERFLCKKGHMLETRPIKGTIQRGRTRQEDEANRTVLLASSKEKAELLMITDLMRNDLGKISIPGSVKVVELWRCEAYANVFHLVSIIRSLVKENLTPLEIVRSCFPGGSITGCPKRSAMQIIDLLESRPRGVYTGSIGYFKGDGDFDLNIAIRTMVAENGVFSLQLGGGIVIDSIPEDEYQEILHKGASFFHLLKEEHIHADPAYQT